MNHGRHAGGTAGYAAAPPAPVRPPADRGDRDSRRSSLRGVGNVAQIARRLAMSSGRCKPTSVSRVGKGVSAPKPRFCGDWQVANAQAPPVPGTRPMDSRPVPSCCWPLPRLYRIRYRNGSMSALTVAPPPCWSSHVPLVPDSRADVHLAKRLRPEFRQPITLADRSNPGDTHAGIRWLGALRLPMPSSTI